MYKYIDIFMVHICDKYLHPSTSPRQSYCDGADLLCPFSFSVGKKVRETVLFYYLYCSSFDSFIFYCGVKICLIFMSTMYDKLIFCIRYNIFTLKLLELGNDDKYFFTLTVPSPTNTLLRLLVLVSKLILEFALVVVLVVVLL